MTTPAAHPPPPDVAQLQARIAELEAERETSRQVAATLYRAYAEARRAAAAWKRAATYWRAVFALETETDTQRIDRLHQIANYTGHDRDRDNDWHTIEWITP